MPNCDFNFNKVGYFNEITLRNRCSPVNLLQKSIALEHLWGLLLITARKIS